MGSSRPEIGDVIKRYCAQLEEMGIRVERVVLFGSHARGEAKEDSDIDLLIVSSDFAQMDELERRQLLSHARARLWQPIHAYPATPEEVANVEPATFLEEILETGILLDDKPQ